MDLVTKTKFLRKVDFLKSLPDLKNLARNCLEVELEAEEILFKDGAAGDCMYIVYDGKLEVSKRGKVIALRGPGEYVGEMALIEGKPRSASIKAKTATRLIRIDLPQFNLFLSNNSKALMALLKTLSSRTRNDIRTIESDYHKLVAQEKLAGRLNYILDESSNEIYVFVADNYRIIKMNRRVRNHLGYSQKEAKEISAHDIIDGMGRENMARLTRPLLSGVPLVSYEGNHFCKDGSSYPVDIRLQLLDFDHPPLIVAVAEDSSQKKIMEEKIQNLAFFDSLTGLPNRNLLNDRFNLGAAHAKRNKLKLAILFLDLDNFKLINDTLGHQAGDLMLREVARRIQTCLRKEDTFARLGGDEFLILLTDSHQGQGAAILSQKIIDVLAAPFNVMDHSFSIGCSIGIVFYPNDGEDLPVLLKHADAAMYQAKENGKNHFRAFTPAMNAKVVKRVGMENDLRKALDRQEFLVYYQPKVDLKTGKISGLEALLRWRKSETEIVSAASFISQAEENGLIVPIGEWALQTVCKQIEEWKRRGISFNHIALNLSVKQLKEKLLVGQILRAVEASKMDPGDLEMELTESVFLEDPASSTKIRELNEMGIRFAIDDFGSGYSSFNYLKSLPIHTLKIDRLFIDGLKNKTDQAIVKAMVSIGKSLKMQTVAEGVETRKQMEFLKSIRCNQIQGYLFSKALPPGEMEKMFKKRIVIP